MVDQEIKIYEKEYKGETVYSITPKKDLEYENSVVVSKKFAEGKSYPNKFNEAKPNFMCMVQIGDVDAAMWLTNKQHEEYKTLGGVDVSIRITRFENRFVQ